MSTNSDTGTDDVPRVHCPVCQSDVPAGAFCGYCGGHLTPEARPGPTWLRLDAFGAAPNESVLRPSLASSLFPHLPTGSRTPFRVGLIFVLAGLVGFAALKLPAALITVAALGLPLLFVLYVRESSVYRQLSAFSIAFAGIAGAGLGVGWVLLIGEMAARSYGVPMVAGLAIHHLVREGLAIPAGAMILMLAPTVIVRVVDRQSRESLDGLVIGALAGLMFSAGSTLTRLAPQFATGLLAHARPRASLVVEAGICGITIPLTGAVAGGMVGIALWFRAQTGNPHERPARTRAALWLLALVVVLIHIGVAITDVIGMPQLQLLAIHVAMTIVVVVLLRISLQMALLREAKDPIQETAPLLCVYCEHVVPDMAFCPACGVATRASSRSSRQQRRESRPVRQPVVEGS